MLKKPKVQHFYHIFIEKVPIHIYLLAFWKRKNALFTD